MEETLQVVVLVKAAPVVTSALEETNCIAAVRVDGGRHEWVRLYPIPFRDLADDSKFKKYQYVTLKVRRPKADRRPESWCPIEGSIVPGEIMGTKQGWARRRQLISELGETTTCRLIENNRNGSGAGVPSLAVVRPVAPPKLEISQRDEEQLKKWRQRRDAKGSLLSLFEDSGTKKPEFEVIPWRFRYSYKCADLNCNGHSQTIVDWEVLAYWRRVRNSRDWKEAMRKRFEDDLWSKRDALLYVGNQEQRPGSFLVLGVFWPPDSPAQTVLPL